MQPCVASAAGNMRCRFCLAAAAVGAGALSASAAEHDAVAAARAELAAQVEALREQLAHAQVGVGEGLCMAALRTCFICDDLQ
jgi:uncharacterized protein YceH (UPF0502 family)